MNKIVLGICLACNDPEAQDFCDDETLRLCAIATIVSTKGAQGLGEACRKVAEAEDEELRKIVRKLDEVFGIRRA